MEEKKKDISPEKETVYEEGDLKIVAVNFQKFALLNAYTREIGEIVENCLNELGKYDLASHFWKAKTDMVFLLWYEEERAKNLGYSTSGLPISANTAFFDNPEETRLDRVITIIVAEEFDWRENQGVIEFVLIHELAHALLEVEDDGKADRITDENLENLPETIDRRFVEKVERYVQVKGILPEGTSTLELKRRRETEERGKTSNIYIEEPLKK